MYLIDSNIHAAFVLQKYEQDEVSVKNVRIFEKILLSERVITDFVLGELETLLVRVAPAKYGLDEVDRLKLKIVTQGYLSACIEKCVVEVPNMAIMKLAYIVYQKYLSDHYISFVDAMLIAMAKNKGYVLMTMDDRLRKRAVEEGVEVFLGE